MTNTIRWSVLPALGLLLIATAGPEPRGYWIPHGFVARADSLISRGHLELVCGVQDSIVVRVPEGTRDAEFFDLSYLRADVRAFNRSPDAARSPFLVEGCRLSGVDPYYHRIDLPYNRLPRWRGALRYTFDGRVSTLEGGRDQLLEVRHPVDERDAGSAAVQVDPARAGTRASGTLLRVRRPSSPEVIADLYYVGASPVLAERVDVGAQDRVLVNGLLTPPGRVVRLEAGDWVELQLAGTAVSRFTYITETGEQASMASFTRSYDDRVHRLFPARRLRSLLEPFSQAIDVALQSVPGSDSPGAAADMDIRLTLEQELSTGLDAVIAAWCSAHGSPSRPRTVSALVMDAFSGGVRAIPSCPTTEELAPYEPLSTRTRERYARNQNLVPHPIGSAGKPFWAAAVASTFPNFLDLTVSAHAAGPAQSVLGCPLRAPYSDTHGAAQPTGIEEFIARSCNRYLIEMATAALALGSGPDAAACRTELSAARFVACFAQPDPALGADASTSDDTADPEVEHSRLRVCDQLINTVLADADAVGTSCDELQLVDSRFAPAESFGAITNAVMYRDPAPLSSANGGAVAAGGLTESYRAERYRIDAWSRVIDVLRAAGDTAPATRTSLRFANVSPQATNLALNTVEELRTDWINLLLGGENSRWSNFELAEAMARLMTGHAVTGELADRVDTGRASEPDEPRMFPALSEQALHPGARRRVLHAMERVVESGTASRLRPALERLRARVESADPERPYDLYVFAKTGTPAVEIFANGGRAAPLARQGGVLLIGLLAVPRELGRQEAARRPDWITACPIDPDLRRRILEVPPPALLDPAQSVGVTAAIYLDDLEVGEGSGRAIELAELMLEPLATYMEREVRRRGTGSR